MTYSERFRDGGEFLQAIVNTSVNGAAEWDCRLEPMASATGASEGVPSDGGFTVATDFAAQLWQRVLDTGDLLAACTRLPMTTSTLMVPAIAETARSTGTRWGGVRTYWTDEAGGVAASKPTFRSMSLAPNKLMAICYATDELLGDAPALAAWLELVFGDEAAFTIEDAIINGSGVGRPLGVLNCDALITVGAESGQASSTVVAANFTGMMARMWGPSRRRAVWLLNNEVMLQAEPLSLSNGAPVVTYGDDGEPRIMGRPVWLSEYAPSLGSDGDVVLMDPSQYVLAERDRDFIDSLHIKYLTGERAFRLRYRVAGQPLWQSAVTPKNGTATQSPYVALAARP